MDGAEVRRSPSAAWSWSPHRKIRPKRGRSWPAAGLWGVCEAPGWPPIAVSSAAPTSASGRTQAGLELQLQDLLRTFAVRYGLCGLDRRRQYAQITGQLPDDTAVGVGRKVHLLDLNPRLGVRDQVVRAEACRNLRSILDPVCSAGQPKRSPEPTVGWLVVHVQGRVECEKMFVPCRVESDDEQVVVDRDIKERDVSLEVLLVLREHVEGVRAMLCALTVQRSRRAAAPLPTIGWPAPFRHERDERRLEQPARLMNPEQEVAELGSGVLPGVGVGEQNSPEQAVERRGHEPRGLVLGQARKLLTLAVDDVDR